MILSKIYSTVELCRSGYSTNQCRWNSFASSFNFPNEKRFQTRSDRNKMYNTWGLKKWHWMDWTANWRYMHEVWTLSNSNIYYHFIFVVPFLLAYFVFYDYWRTIGDFFIWVLSYMLQMEHQTVCQRYGWYGSFVRHFYEKDRLSSQAIYARLPDTFWAVISCAINSFNLEFFPYLNDTLSFRLIFLRFSWSWLWFFFVSRVVYRNFNWLLIAHINE